MAVNFDTLTVAAAPLPGRIERHGAEARKDRFMLELERAAMAAEGNQQGARDHDGAHRRPAPALEDAPAARAHAAITAGASAAAAGPLAAGLAPQPGQGGAAASTVAAALARSAASARHGAVQAPLSMPASLAGVGPELELDGAEPQRAAPQLPDAHAGPQEFASALLHVYRAQEGVHAWIRDARLSQGQVQRVAAAMAGQFAQSGERLAGLTINGKSMTSAAVRDADRNDDRAVLPPFTQYAVKGA